MLMEIALTVSKRSTCSRASVGVVIARDGRPLVTGYNGAPAGMDHCNHDCDCDPLHYPVEYHSLACATNQPCTISVHAEANAVAFAARWGISLEGAEVFTTLVPCLSCAQILINSGINRVISHADYRDGRGLALLEKAGIALR